MRIRLNAKEQVAKLTRDFHFMQPWDATLPWETSSIRLGNTGKVRTAGRRQDTRSARSQNAVSRARAESRKACSQLARGLAAGTAAAQAVIR